MRAIMSDRARLQRMLDFEAALARAEAAVGVISASGRGRDRRRLRRRPLSTLPALVEAAVPSGNIAIAMVNALTAEVARSNKTAAGFVHWGATSQDVIDTALVLELRAAIDALLVDLEVAIKGFTTLAGRHRRTLTAARTMMQQALPMPFGLKLAGYAAALARSRERLLRLRRDALVLQFGGAAGTLAALGERRPGACPSGSRRCSTCHCPRRRGTATATGWPRSPPRFAILTGTCGKIARDVALMMQIEVGEASEPDAPGRGGSSTLPHKRNPAAPQPRSRPLRSRPISWRPFSPRRSRSTSAASAPGRPNGPRSRRWRSSPPARSKPWPASPKASRSMSSACARTSSGPADAS